MRKIVFLTSHLGSGSDVLYKSLNAHPRIQGYKSSENNLYVHPFNLLSLVNCRHKLHNSSAIYMDELLYNYSLSTKYALNVCKFIYVIRDAESTLNLLMENESFKKPIHAQRYYLYRLRRICEMAKRTPGAVVLNYYDIKNKKGSEAIQNYLNLKEPFEFLDAKLPEPTSLDLVSPKLVQEADEAFEKYWYFLKNQDLSFS